MLENILILCIVSLCAFLLGRKYYRQWRAALDPSSSPACASSCCGCADEACSQKK